MKNNIIMKSAVMLVVLLTMMGCDKENPITYDSTDTKYYFSYKGNEVGQVDSTRISFYDYPELKDEDIIYLEVTTMGAPSNVDRAVKIEQVYIYDEFGDPYEGNWSGDKTQTDPDYIAEPGVDYVAFDDPRVTPSLWIKAGESKTRIPLIIKYREKSKEEQNYMVLRIALETSPGGIGLAADHTEFVLRHTAKYTQPSNWSSYNYWFGTWGPAKMDFIVATLGSMPDWSTLYTMNAFNSWCGRTCGTAYAQYLTDHDNVPIYEKDGTPVSFPQKF